METSLSIDCRPDGFYDNSDKESQIRAVEKRLGIEKSYVVDKNMEADELQDYAKMFIFLNICPGPPDSDTTAFRLFNMPWKKFFHPWYTFYNELFKTQSPNKIILTLNRFMKTDTVEKEDFTRNQKLFKKTASILKLKYEVIRSFLPGVTEKTSITSDNVTLKSEEGICKQLYI